MDTSSSSDDGIIVSRLTDNGPAEKSGLLLEDRIIKVRLNVGLNTGPCKSHERSDLR